MKTSNKRRLMLMTGLLMVLVTLLVIGALNIAFTAYIEQEARAMMAQEQQSFLAVQPLEQQAYRGSSPVQVQSLVVTADYSMEDTYYQYVYGISPLEQAIIAHCRANPQGAQGIEALRLLNEELYISRVAWPVLPGEQPLMLILYANITPLKGFLLRLNLVFLGLLLGFGLAASLLGMRLGRHIDNAQEKSRRLFANASHELKSPLMVIQGYAEGIQAGLVADSGEAAGLILSASERMAALVDELLFLSKMESGALNSRRLSFSLAELVQDCGADMQPLASRQGIQLVYDLPEDLPLCVGDPAQLRRVILNLLSNAIRYAQHQVRLSLTSQGRRLQLQVADDGPGIAPADLPHIFDRFYAGARGQSGIGLSIARDIALLHGGRLTAENGAKGAPAVPPASVNSRSRFFDTLNQGGPCGPPSLFSYGCLFPRLPHPLTQLADPAASGPAEHAGCCPSGQSSRPPGSAPDTAAGRSTGCWSL